MPKAKYGDTIKLHYTGCCSDGSVFISTKGNPPIEVRLGDATLIPGLEASVVGMETGDTKTVIIPPEQAYGPRKPELVFHVRRTDMPDDIVLTVGKKVTGQRRDGSLVQLLIASVSEGSVTLDANHPLAGQALSYDIHLVEFGESS
ncbi:MAG: peptidylprolyl isomerase [Thermodesulfobacteriota bacterium]|nr:peptidylprolyl isomerase [Thermodesulfobacteriota bacterium]